MIELSAALTSQISGTFPELTVHDQTHINALWAIADTIAGPGYPLNPAEAYVLGGAFSIHDAALCFEAYEGGKSAFRKTVDWRDVYSLNRSRKTDQEWVSENKEEFENLIDFITMRRLHAQRASELATDPWKLNDADPIYLIEDAGLRKHYGPTIGLVAASHQWKMSDLESRLRHQLNAPAFLHLSWKVNPIKIACLLRCADAAHLDSQRAPDYLFAMIQRHGLSAKHWRFQNRLEQVDIDGTSENKDTLLFTSGRPFSKQEYESWWLTYDAINVVAQELQDVNNLLSTGRNPDAPPFRVTTVTGSNSPKRLAKTIPTSGWEPEVVKLHVSRIEHLIKTIGGQSLYNSRVPTLLVLRELIQNARDAVVARRFLEPGFQGRITIDVSEVDHNIHLVITDNGVGMAETTLIGPLLDFGVTFWTSDSMLEQFPGLRSSDFESVGTFGIGFHSVFMIADSVAVASRRFDKSVSDIVQIAFPKGLSLRPILSREKTKRMGLSDSTSVSLKFTKAPGMIDPIVLQAGASGIAPKIEIPLNQALAFTCVGLDVDLWLTREGVDGQLLHRNIYDIVRDGSGREWVAGFAGTIHPSAVDDFEEHAKRLRPLYVGNKLRGFAALVTSVGEAGTQYDCISTVGGLAPQVYQNRSGGFVGFIDHFAGSARREIGAMAVASDALENWGDEQASLLKPFSVDPVARCVAAVSLAQLGCDPTSVFAIFVADKTGVRIYDLNQTIELIQNRGLAYFTSSQFNGIETSHEQISYEEIPTFKPILAAAFASLSTNADGSVVSWSFLSCIIRRAESMGLTILQDKRPDIAPARAGRMGVVILTAKPT